MAELCTGCAANVLSDVVSCLWKKVVEEVKMVISLPQSIIRMKTDAKTLEYQIHDINAELRRQPAKKIVKNWLDEAGKAIESSGSIDNKYQTYQQHRTCLGCCLNCLPRYRICKDIREWKLIFAQLQSYKQSKFPSSGEYGDPTPRTQIPIQNSESILVGKAMRSEQMKLLVEWLTVQDSDIRRIGIQGMGGVGKTSLLNAINNSTEVSNSFELIIKVTVSRNNILDMQNCVADRLNLLQGFPDRSNFEGRKDRLRLYLQNKKCLLLLDDVWEDSDLSARDHLEKLGFDDTGFKLVLTTRDERVCKSMNVQQRIRVEVLQEDEGWELFRSRAFQNRNGDLPQELEVVARKIAKECKCLPLAINVVAAAMAHYTDVREWEVALAQMQKVDETFYELHRGVELFQPLRLSYDALGDELKTCFLYFAAYPEDREICCDELIDMWIAEGVVKDTGDIYLQDIGQIYMNRLRDRCLIQVVDTGVVKRMVKIHDILCDLAIMIAEKEKRCYFRAGQGGTHFPRVEEGWTRMSLVSTQLPSLPTTFTCSSLPVLLLSHNPDIKEVPGSFLRSLPSLKVLDLSKTGITSLPPSIGNLKHLVFLQLSTTRICELPETIGDLKELQFLNVAGCDQLRCLPERIRELKRLRSLNVSLCLRLSHLPRGISELVLLERLEMNTSGNLGSSNISFDFEDDSNAERNYVCLKDLQSLSRLRRFYAEIKLPVKEGFMGNWSKMRDLDLTFNRKPSFQEEIMRNESAMRFATMMFNVVIKDYLPQDMLAMKDLERLRLIDSNVERLPSWVSEFGKLASLEFVQCRELKELPADLPCLTHLSIIYSPKLMEVELGMSFSKLETLFLWALTSLECVRVGTAASGNGGLGEGVSQLKSLTIRRCKKLKTLRGEWDKLKCLEVIEGTSEWWDKIQCDDPNIKTSLESKFRRIEDY